MNRETVIRPLNLLLLAVTLTLVPVKGWTEETTGAATDSSLGATDVQVLLTRHGFIPGLIDGEEGPQTREALAAFQEAQGLEPTGKLDAESREVLRTGQPDETVVEYRIGPEDVDGPFGFSFPEDGRNLKVLPPYGRLSPAHYLAKKFRTTPEFLNTLNPDAGYEAGEVIRVPNVRPVQQKP